MRAPPAEERLERFGLHLGVGGHSREALGVVGLLAGEREPLCRFGVGSDRLGAVACLDGLAAGTDRVGRGPCGDAATQDLAAVVFDQANLRVRHRDLLRSFKAGAIDWPAFEQAYRGEMTADAQRAEIVRLAALAAEGDVTVMCACVDEAQCHRRLLRELIAAEMASNERVVPA